MSPKKTLWRYFLFFFLSFFLIFNWSKISWLFHPGYFVRFISYQFFEKKDQPESSNDEKIAQIKGKEVVEEVFEREDSIEIKKIAISAPLIYVKNEQEVKKALDRGVVLWPYSSMPNEKGQIVILGHSAPPNWPKIKYDWVFSNLNLLEKGDEIVVYYQKRKYVFSVQEKLFLNKGQELPQTNSEKSILFLISCWPPGKDLRRIAIVAEKINN